MLAKDIIVKNVSDLILANDSHKTSGVIKKLEKSINKFGIQQPVIIDKNNKIVAHNALFKAACNLGIKEVPCILVDHLSEDELKQYRIADNKTSEFAKWNQQMLKKEMSYLVDVEDLQFCFDEDLMSMVGYKKEEPQVSPTVPNSSNNSDDTINYTPSVIRVDSDSNIYPDVSSTTKPLTDQEIQKAKEKEEKEVARFQESINATEKAMVVKPNSYREFECSKCGRIIRVKL